MPNEKPKKDALDSAVSTIIISGAAGAAAAVAEGHNPQMGFALGALKGTVKTVGEAILKLLAEVQNGRPKLAERFVDGEFAAAVQRDHAEAFVANVDAIPPEHRASEVAAAAVAAAAAWRKSAGAKKRRVITAMFVNALDEENLNEGDGVRMLEVVSNLDYAELYFLKHRFSSGDKLVEVGKLGGLDADGQRRLIEQTIAGLAAGSEGNERLQRLTEHRLVQGDLTGRQVYYIQRTWLGNRVLEYCGSDAFREDMPSED